MSRTIRLSSVILAMAGLLAIGSGATASAAVQDPVPIGPNEFFIGLVNGSNGVSSPAIIQTSCFGPVQPGQTGHPLPGQTVEVQEVVPVSVGTVGYTGNADSITAYLGWPYPAAATTLEPVATFSSYYVKEPIPVTLTVPCGGQGAMVFVPNAPPNVAAPTGRSDTVPVTFEGQP